MAVSQTLRPALTFIMDVLVEDGRLNTEQSALSVLKPATKDALPTLAGSLIGNSELNAIEPTNSRAPTMIDLKYEMAFIIPDYRCKT